MLSSGFALVLIIAIEIAQKSRDCVQNEEKRWLLFQNGEISTCDLTEKEEDAQEEPEKSRGTKSWKRTSQEECGQQY
jgi:hypothetical protein